MGKQSWASWSFVFSLALCVSGASGCKKKAPQKSEPPTATQAIKQLPVAPETPLLKLLPDGLDVVMSTADLGQLIKTVRTDPQYSKILASPFGEDLEISAWTKLPFMAAARVRSYTASPLSPVSYEEALHGPAVLAFNSAADGDQFLFIKALDPTLDAVARLAMAWQGVAARDDEVIHSEVEHQPVITLALGKRHLHYAVLRNRFFASTDKELLRKALARLDGMVPIHYALDDKSPLAAAVDVVKVLDLKELNPLLDGLKGLRLAMREGFHEARVELDYAGTESPPALPPELLRVAPRDAIVWVSSSRGLPPGSIDQIGGDIADKKLHDSIAKMSVALAGPAAWAFLGIDRSGKTPTIQQVIAFQLIAGAAGEALALDLGRRLFLSEGSKPVETAIAELAGQKMTCFPSRLEGYQPCFAVARSTLLVAASSETLHTALAAFLGQVPSLADRPEAAAMLGKTPGQAAVFVDPARFAAFLERDVLAARPKRYTEDDVKVGLGAALEQVKAMRPTGGVLTRAGTAANGIVGAL